MNSQEKFNPIPQVEWHQSQRGYFVGTLYNEMIKNKDIWVVVADLGYGAFDRIRDDFPKRFINVGASEMAGMGICVGLALENKIPFFYSITPFAIFRPFETIRNYVDHENISVKIIGVGRDKDYHVDGWSHHATDIKPFMKLFKNIDQYWPETKEELPNMVLDIIQSDKPSFISLKR